MTTIRLTLPEGGYPVHVHQGLLHRIGDELEQAAPGDQGSPPARPTVGIITDSNLALLHLETVTASLQQARYRTVEVVLTAGERHKTIDSARLCWDTLLAAGVDRDAIILGLGGGVVTDIAGFVAATLLRGLRYIPVPTSLLAMVDASIGGKTGVNHHAGKNLIGAFHQPAAVLIDPAVLATLPEAELRAGLAECIKHDVIRDADHFTELEAAMPDILAGDIDTLTRLVAHNVAIKAGVVEADPFEHGERAHLNFGHTFGHAFERASDYALPHGEAVAAGMCAAMRVSLAQGLVTPATVERVCGLIAAAGLPTGGLRLDVDRVMAAMNTDKKARGGRLRFVLPDRIGHVTLRDDVPPEIIRAATASVC